MHKLSPSWLEVRCSSIGDLDDVILGVSMARAESFIDARKGCYFVFVHAGSSTLETLSITTKSGSTSSIVLQVGEMVILEEGSTATLWSSGKGNVLYQVPDLSLRRFALYRRLTGVDSLHCNRICPDAVLQHLSRATRLLLQESRRAVEPVGDALVRSFYSHILDCYGRKGLSRGEVREGLTSKQRRLIDQTLATSLGDKISLTLLAARCELTPAQLARSFRKSYGQPFIQYLITVRIRRAKELLRSTELTLPSIAKRIGYANQATFTESFTKMVGTPPGRFRRISVGSQSAAPADGG